MKRFEGPVMESMPRQELFSLLQRIIDFDHISLHFRAGNVGN